jgi:hypothetical protein
MPATLKTVRQLALALGGVRECTSYGTPAFKISGGSGFLRMHQDGKSLVVKTSFEQRKELMEADPATYYITAHYLEYEWVLVSLARVNRGALRDLVRMAWRAASLKKRGSSRRRVWND